MATYSFNYAYIDAADANYDGGDTSITFEQFVYGSPFEDWTPTFTAVSIDTGAGGAEALNTADNTGVDFTLDLSYTSPDGTEVATFTPITVSAYYLGATEDGGIVISPYGAPETPVTFTYTDPSTGAETVTGNETFSLDGYFVLSDVYYPSNATATLEVNVTDPFVLCFGEGTRIATPDGEVAVETLAIGDLVLTVDGRAVSVKWLGRQTIDHRFGPPERLAPVVISAGALGENVPHSDLHVTADHGMILDGVLVQAAALVNGSSIRRVALRDLPPRRVVYHIETESHDVVLANGAASETFIDNVSRRCFDNYDEYRALYGNPAEIAPMNLPRAKSPRQVPAAIKARIAAQVAASATTGVAMGVAAA